MRIGGLQPGAILLVYGGQTLAYVYRIGGGTGGVEGGGAGMSFSPPGSGRDAPSPPPPQCPMHHHWDQYIWSIPPPQVKFSSAASGRAAVTIIIHV